MALETWLYEDPTGGGTMIVMAGSGSALTVPKDVDIVGYFLGGTSGQHVLMQVTGNKDWESGGVYFENTMIATTLQKDPIVWLPHRIPLKKGDVMAFTSTSGANPHILGLYVDDGTAPTFKPPMANGEGRSNVMSLVSAASGLNTTALTAQLNTATTTLTSFMASREYKLNDRGPTLFTAMTGPTVLVGIQDGASAYITWWPVVYTPAAQRGFYRMPADGLPKFTKGSNCRIHWCSEAAEQPRVILPFAYAP